MNGIINFFQKLFDDEPELLEKIIKAVLGVIVLHVPNGGRQSIEQELIGELLKKDK